MLIITIKLVTLCKQNSATVVLFLTNFCFTSLVQLDSFGLHDTHRDATVFVTGNSTQTSLNRSFIALLFYRIKSGKMYIDNIRDILLAIALLYTPTE